MFASVAGRTNAMIAINAVFTLAVSAIDVLTLVDIEITVGTGYAGWAATNVTGCVCKIELLTVKRRMRITKTVQSGIGSFVTDAVVVTRTGFTLLNVVLTKFTLIAGLTIATKEGLQINATSSVLARLIGTFVNIFSAILSAKSGSGALATITVYQIDALACFKVE